MTTNTHGITPGRDTSIRKARGGLATTTATTNNATKAIARYARIKGAGVCFAAWLTVIFRGGDGMNTDTTNYRRFATLKAEFARHGHTLHQSSPGDGPGPVSYMAEKWGLARYLPTLDDAEQFLVQVGEAGHAL